MRPVPIVQADLNFYSVQISEDAFSDIVGIDILCVDYRVMFI